MKGQVDGRVVESVGGWWRAWKGGRVKGGREGKEGKEGRVV